MSHFGHSDSRKICPPGAAIRRFGGIPLIVEETLVRDDEYILMMSP